MLDAVSPPDSSSLKTFTDEMVMTDALNAAAAANAGSACGARETEAANAAAAAPAASALATRPKTAVALNAAAVAADAPAGTPIPAAASNATAATKPGSVTGATAAPAS